MHAVAYMKNAISPCYVCVQVREVGLPGPMDPVLIPVGRDQNKHQELHHSWPSWLLPWQQHHQRNVEIVAATVSITCAVTCLPPCLYINLGLYPITRITDSNSSAINPMQAEKYEWDVVVVYWNKNTLVHTCTVAPAHHAINGLAWLHG